MLPYNIKLHYARASQTALNPLAPKLNAQHDAKETTNKMRAA
jgi:hypothetical protein